MTTDAKSYGFVKVTTISTGAHTVCRRKDFPSMPPVQLIVVDVDMQFELWITCLLPKLWDSTFFQLAMGAVVHGESASAVRVDRFFHRNEKERKTNLRESLVLIVVVLITVKLLS